MARTEIELGPFSSNRIELDEPTKAKLKASPWWMWMVIAEGPNGATPSARPYPRFRFDPSQPSSVAEPEVAIGPDGLIVSASLRGDPKPQFGKLVRATSFSPSLGPDAAARAIKLNGQDQMLVYALPEEFTEDFSVAVSFRLTALPEKRIGQIFSAWAASMDDPLRLTIDGGKLFARIEAQQAYSTKGVPVEVGRWHHVAAVKSGGRLTLYLDRQARESVAVPQFINTAARQCALGGNPKYSGNEFLAAEFAGFVMYARGLSATEIESYGKSSGR